MGLGSTSPGSVLHSFNSSDDLPFNGVSAVKLDSVDNLYIADQFNDRVCVLTSMTSTTIAPNSPGTELFIFALPTSSQPRDVALDNVGNVYVTGEGTNIITVFSSIASNDPGRVLHVFTDVTSPFQAGSLRGIALDTENRVYVACAGSGLVIVLAALSFGLLPGTELFRFSNSDDAGGVIFEPVGVALDTSGRIYVTTIKTVSLCWRRWTPPRPAHVLQLL